MTIHWHDDERVWCPCDEIVEMPPAEQEEPEQRPGCAVDGTCCIQCYAELGTCCKPGHTELKERQG